MVMEANADGRALRLLNGGGKKGLEWDLNDWTWDGDLFIATPTNTAPFDCRSNRLFPVPSSIALSMGSPSCSDKSNESVAGMNGKGKGELEKRRKVIVMDDHETSEETGPLTLTLGGEHVCPRVEEDYAVGVGFEQKGREVQAGGSNRGMCQVDGCGADLRCAKDYHRRHKVCEVHAKASKALVGNVIQRFCQQCSRFHHLKEFDEGKRSCRRRLAGHNRRRRKSPIDTAINNSPLTNDQSSSFLLTSLLMILSNLQTKSNEQLKDQDLLSHFLRNLANLARTFDSRRLCALLQASQDLKRLGDSARISSEEAQPVCSNDPIFQESFRLSCPRHATNHGNEVPGSAKKPGNEPISSAVPAMELPRKRSILECSPDCTKERVHPKVESVRMRNFDLNDVYNENDIVETESRKRGATSLDHSQMLQESHHSSSPPQTTSGNSDSASIQSIFSSNGEAQDQTDRISFKLFGKDPKDFPVFLREQILGWLTSTPTDIESYIKPGCVILTVYLRLSESTWNELCNKLHSNLRRLLDVDDNDFWRTGWLYTRIRDQMAIVYNGQVLLDSHFLGVNNKCTRLSVSPIAVPVSTTVKFTIKSFNLVWSSMRFFCAFEGKYLAQETAPSLISSVQMGDLTVGRQFSFSCSLPDVMGRGFIEIEDHSLGGAFFPFIVAEPEVCSEICMLEGTLDIEKAMEEKSGVEARAQALNFLQEMGWLLHRCQLRSKSPENLHRHTNVFPLERFKRLMEFSMEHEWCAVLRKLLNILVGGIIDMGGRPVEVVLEEMSLLHGAVRKNSRSMVELLLCYIPSNHVESIESESAQVGRLSRSFLFKADMTSTKGQTPLHLAASQGDTEAVLDALTDDPLEVGIAAWKSARDSAGLTPEDYAHSNGFEAYTHLVREKIKKKFGSNHVVLDVHEGSRENRSTSTFETSQSKSAPRQQSYCNTCSRQHLAYNKRSRPTLLYRPTTLSMFGIAGVCVCVGLLLKGLPEVHFVHAPFRWEAVGFGTM